MPKGIKGFQKGHKSFLIKETYVRLSKERTGKPQPYKKEK